MITRLSLVTDADEDPTLPPTQLAVLQDHNTRRQRQAAERVIATIATLREHGTRLDPTTAAVADARIAHPDFTYDELADSLNLNASAVARALWLIETKARLIQQAA